MLKTNQRYAIRYIFRLGRSESVINCMKEYAIDILETRRQEFDKNVLKRLNMANMTLPYMYMTMSLLKNHILPDNVRSLLIFALTNSSSHF